MAAAVFVPPSPHDPLAKMANPTRRMPLASLSNATNSPHRPLTNSGSKRPRSIANVPQQENEPPQKRLAVDRATRESNTPTPRKTHPSQPTVAEARVFERGGGEGAANAFQKSWLLFETGVQDFGSPKTWTILPRKSQFVPGRSITANSSQPSVSTLMVSLKMLARAFYARSQAWVRYVYPREWSRSISPCFVSDLFLD